MAEGPEVKLMTEFLKKHLYNKTISDWFINNNTSEDYNIFKNCLPMVVEDIYCKGKIIILICHNEYHVFYIIHNLKLTGKWSTFQDNFKWYIETTENKKIFLNDSKNSASVYFTEDENILKSVLDSIGIDILSNEFTLNELKNQISKYKNKNITSFLMNQSIFSGIGNYLKCEILYYSKISPLRKMTSLSDSEIEKLFEGIRIISRTSYASGGIFKGYFEFNIYKDEKAKKEKTSDGRTTFWDEKLQN